MRFDILTLFPDIFSGYLQESILSKALARGLVEVHRWDMRDWSDDPHRRVDDRPFGGGAGMVIRAQPVVDCVEAVRSQAEPPGRLILLTPQGQRLDQSVVEELAQQRRLVIICGRYEGFDQRVVDILEPQEISLGDFVLNGGDVAAMAIIDAVIRLIPGVLGDERSSREDSFSLSGRRLKCEQYTRPQVFRDLAVPDVLLSGNHEQIEQWRRQRSDERTRERSL
jgi:tRNA (guanine37-N1)-methyltransferase